LMHSNHKPQPLQYSPLNICYPQEFHSDWLHVLCFMLISETMRKLYLALSSV
jgi:hypothetical protein